jgi:hypothetical protein
LDPAGGQVIVTRFECPGVFTLGYLAMLHWRIKREVRRSAEGLIAARAVLDWRRRILFSVTLWRDIESVYAMGDVRGHVAAARIPARLGIRTRCGVFCFAGDWRRVMFHGQAPPGTPLK